VWNVIPPVILGVRGDKPDQVVDLRLAAGEGTRAALLALLPPVSRKVAVQVEALFVPLKGQRVAVPVFQGSLGSTR